MTQQTEAERVLYDITGNICDVNTILINRAELRRQQAEIERLRAVSEGFKLVPVARVEFIEDSGYPFIQRIPGARLSQGDTLYLAAEQPIYQHEPLTHAEIEITTGRLPLPSMVELVRAIERAHGIGVAR